MLRGLSRQAVEALKDGKIISEDDDTYTVSCYAGAFVLVVSKQDESLTPCLVGGSMPGLWETWITAWLTDNLREGDCFVDIGANCGYYTMLGSKLVGEKGRVIAYEPSPVYSSLLKRTRKQNRAPYNVYEYAVSDRSEIVTLSYPGNLSGSASIVHDFGEHRISVPATTLDVELNSGFLTCCDFLKIDAEGAEEKIWDGGFNTLKGVRTVLMEWTPHAYSDVFPMKLQHWGKVYTINFAGAQVPASPQFLNKTDSMQMLAIHRHE